MRTLLLTIVSGFVFNLLYSQSAAVQIGRSANAFTILTTGQNQVYANDSLKIIGFIHRQDPAVWGGSSGQLRIDVSLDGGQSFSSDLGVINPENQLVSRYPQLTAYNPPGNTNPFELSWIWNAPTLSPSGVGWEGNANGTFNISPEFDITAKEQYQFSDEGVYLTSGLSEGKPGEFWTATLERPENNYSGNVIILKGKLNNENGVTWEINQVINLDLKVNNLGGFALTECNLAFSPDGEIGWVSVLSDKNGGQDGVLNPILISTRDGGATWSEPIEISLNEASYFGDSATIAQQLQGIYTDSLGNPISLGIATCTFEHDLTVDKFGNPHFFSTIGSAAVFSNPEPAYSVYNAFPMLAADITSPDGGLTWEIIKIADLNTLRGAFGMPDPLFQDNYPQISRSSDGSKIFYSWVDTDTINLDIVSGNESPNLIIAGMDIESNTLTCPKWVSKGDFLFHNNALFPTMAPVSLSDTMGNFYLPIVLLRGLSENLYASCDFWYMGNLATLSEEEFIIPLTIPEDCEIACLGTSISSSFIYSQEASDYQFTSVVPDLSPDSLFYFWDFGDGTFSSEANPVHVFDESGNYKVCFSVSDGCAANKFCQTIEVVLSATSEWTPSIFKVYPNPSSDVLVVETKMEVNALFSMFNSAGAKVIERQLNNHITQMDVRHLDPGIYWCTLLTSNDKEIIKLVVE